ncbi:hypothetical protein HMPREF0239_04331 [Clostridium sp. ATCC BAA-442]|nr:hypothetical protein HMPREF0239_04331 [Clostridium sp. ATCC BAA-442]
MPPIGILSIISCHFTIDSEKSPCGNREIRGGKDEVSVKNHQVPR